MVQEGIALEHQVNKRGLEVEKAKKEVIKSLPLPSNLKEVRSFLGHTCFYRRFIQNYAQISKPLKNLLSKDIEFIVDEPVKSAFNTLKEALIEAPILQPPNWSLPFEIYCDASEFSVGAVLGQRKEQKHVAIFYASKTLNGPQLHYSITEKELLAVIFALENLGPTY